LRSLDITPKRLKAALKRPEEALAGDPPPADVTIASMALGFGGAIVGFAALLGFFAFGQLAQLGPWLLLADGVWSASVALAGAVSLQRGGTGSWALVGSFLLARVLFLSGFWVGQIWSVSGSHITALRLYSLAAPSR
jgi:hypothetical protein